MEASTASSILFHMVALFQYISPDAVAINVETAIMAITMAAIDMVLPLDPVSIGSLSLKSFTSSVSLNSTQFMFERISLTLKISGANDGDSKVIPSICNLTVFSQEKNLGRSLALTRVITCCLFRLYTWDPITMIPLAS